MYLCLSGGSWRGGGSVTSQHPPLTTPSPPSPLSTSPIRPSMKTQLCSENISRLNPHGLCSGPGGLPAGIPSSASSDCPCVVVVGGDTWWPAVRAADKQQQRAEPHQSNTVFSATTSPSPKLTLSRRSPAAGTRWCTRKTRTAHRSPADRRRGSDSNRDQPHTTASRQTRHASTCSLSPATFRLTLATNSFISGGFMGADGCRWESTGRGPADRTRASCPEPVPAAGLTFSEVRSELPGYAPLFIITVKNELKTKWFPVLPFNIKVDLSVTFCNILGLILK